MCAGLTLSPSLTLIITLTLTLTLNRPFSDGEPGSGAVVGLWLVVIAIGAAIGIKRLP